MEKPQASVGAAATGTRRATEFRITIESAVDFVRSWSEGRDRAFISSAQDLGLNRAMPRTRTTHLSFKPLDPPSCPSPSGKSFRSCVSKSITQLLVLYSFSHTPAFTRSDTDCFQTHEVPVVLLRPPERSAPLWNPSRRDICSNPSLHLA